ncbi:gamma-glutamyl-gamma-aminobutyrate hydrolase family protein [Fulvivirgaceae bacterium PWU4]|uniref:Gamma-glutamyl-gamma-aminobutyrate hydrolase family protein n=1 Tax=Chryseosolibacter histidini TaxID=2782349 RepID=A0AAP2GIT5_9BACT|nr:gamma-glutamyl-gamma-aminobutyrate hydrolase family protein [Chryseosolibacter histidini]MBT1697611.1 gamma-glutamyl-gamma-aminobutyrate hydrolase family protein [Chryseosolibacter histidini]
MKPITIGITDCSKYPNYEQWIRQEADTEVIRLSYKENNFADIERCQGIILSGGEDVHPRFYNKMEYLEYCDEIDERRDEFEWKVLEYTESKQLPLLGICRGLQMANVFYGGTLVPDIPSFGRFNHSRFADKDRYHTVQVDANSMLRKIAGSEIGEINSAHHQSAELIGKGLVSNALSPDGIVEGIERKNGAGKPYLQLVQWHPERMTDLGNPFSKNIKLSFLEAVREGVRSKE